MDENYGSIKLSSKMTIRAYLEYEADKNRSEIAQFVFERLTERYINPQKSSVKKHGFSIMANCCLLIETYESFRKGLCTTDGKSQKQFTSFFEREERFSAFKNSDFYKNVRCGILHQGETTKGWRITREEGHDLFDPVEKRINAQKFLEELENVLEEYCKELKTADWDSDLWEKCRKKINHIIKNCKS